MPFYEENLTVVDSLPNANVLRPEFCTKLYARMYCFICNNEMVSQTTFYTHFHFHRNQSLFLFLVNFFSSQRLHFCNINMPPKRILFQSSLTKRFVRARTTNNDSTHIHSSRPQNDLKMKRRGLN